MSKHTPGPWVVTKKPGVIAYDITQQTGQFEREIATVGPSESNARLIAAAPEMLEALKLANCWCQHRTDFSGNLVRSVTCNRCYALEKAGEDVL